MDIKRRDFFRSLGSKSAVLAVGAVTPAIIYMDSFKIEMGALRQEFSRKLAKPSDELMSQIQSLNSRLDRTA